MRKLNISSYLWSLSYLIVGTVILLYFFDTFYFLLYILIFLSIIGILHLYNADKRAEIKILRHVSELSDKRLVVIRKLVDLSYTYECDKSLFFEKFREAVSIEILRREQIVETGQLLQNKIEKSTENSQDSKLSVEDIEMCCLMVNGFTPRELSVLYGLKNPKSIYVKQHRLKNKLQSL